MSWTDVFPVLTDEMVDEYESSATPLARQELKEFFTVERVFNRQDVPHIISVSLFWKSRTSRKTNHANRDLDTFRQYSKPIITGSLLLRSSRQDICFRVYLAADLEFMIPDLVGAGCEVHLMKSRSMGNNPGVLWRFLALEEENKLVTVLEAERAMEPEHYILLTEQTAGVGVGFWRIPLWEDLSKAGDLTYRPISGSQMGCLRPLPTRVLMEALIWQTRFGGIQKVASPPGLRPKRIQGTEWVDHGFDEWFLLAALYPRVAFEGILTFLPAWAKSRLLPLDIEYCTWANPQSELIHYGTYDESADSVSKAAPSPSSVTPWVPDKPPHPIEGRRKELQDWPSERPEHAVLLYLAQKNDAVESRQMLSLLVSSLIKTEFGGDILLWREQGPPVIKGPQSTEVMERLGQWAPALDESHAPPNDLVCDPALSKYRRVILLGPGTLACRNLEYLLVDDEATLVVPGTTLADSPLSVFTPPDQFQQSGLSDPNAKVKPLERGAVVMVKAREKPAPDGTLVCIMEQRAEDQLLGIWQTWLDRFAPEEAEALGQLFSDSRARFQSPSRSLALA